MSTQLEIEVASDFLCPWCATRYFGIRKALQDLDPDLKFTIRFKAFELEPDLQEPTGYMEHVAKIHSERRGVPEPVEQTRAGHMKLAGMAAAVGLNMTFPDGFLIVNSNKAHQLVAWAAETAGLDKHLELAHRIFKSHWEDPHKRIDLIDVLVDAAEAVGLDGAEARAVLEENRFADKVDAQKVETARFKDGDGGVPGWFFNGVFCQMDSQTQEVFTANIKKALGQE